MTVFPTKRTTPAVPGRLRNKGRFYSDLYGGQPCPFPSVTTVIGNTLAAPELVEWRLKTACQDIITQAVGLYTDLGFNGQKVSPSAFESSLRTRIGDEWADKRISNKEAGAGDRAHALIEWHLKGEMGVRETMPEVPESSQLAYEAWKKWRQVHDVKPMSLEHTLWSTVHYCAGRIDFYGEIDGRFTIADWKSSGAIYPAYKVQLGGYDMMAQERGMKVEQTLCLRLDKKTGQFNPDKDVALAEFDHVRQAYSDYFIWLRKLYTFLNAA